MQIKQNRKGNDWMENVKKDSVKAKARYKDYDFSNADVFDISKARENTKKRGYPKIHEYANKVVAKINDKIKEESESGGSSCSIYVNLKEVFGAAKISSNDYYTMIDYITGLYSVNGYNISVYSSRMVMRFPIERDDIYLKACVSWE